MYNLQGGVIALIDTNGTWVVEYRYDAWGKPIGKTGPLATTLATLNPFRYRGYVYDEETGLYPTLCRFVNMGTTDVLNVPHYQFGQYSLVWQ